MSGLPKSTADAPSRRGKGRIKALRREQLLRAALDLFARGDFATVTNKDLSAAAGMNPALIYYYFESKEHLFRSALEFGVQLLLDEYQTILQGDRDPVARIRHWFRINVDMADTVRQVVKIMIDYQGLPDSAFSIDDLVQHFYQQEEKGILASCIREGIRMGLFRKVNASRTARFVSIHLDGVMTACLARREMDVKGRLRELEHFLWWHLGYDPVSGCPAGPGQEP